MNLLGKVIHGSRLYRLENAKSDWDYKGIFLPTSEECLLGRAPHNVQRKEGEGPSKVEYEAFSLQEFLKLAARGEDVAFTMLHVQKEDVRLDTHIYGHLRSNRKRFYTKSMRGSVGYAKSMAAKYGLRADRMAAVERVISILSEMERDGVARLGQDWDRLTEGEYVVKTISVNDRGADKRVLEVAGKMLPATITPAYALDILCRLRDGYGDRVRSAKNMNGVELKALSHSFRVGYQLLHVYKDGDFSFPLPESDFIRAVKEGRLNYVDDNLDDKLNQLISEVESLAMVSAYPDNVDQKWLDEIVLWAYSSMK